ncbi:MAG: prepilin-type N-terminal cleavage/methylation domain-containing protein [Lachnospiraceae bacterium]|nr:prepilin-type N-terminal cleavage/methylation domain-containing protein [Lachnospiraceae bacterium]
MKRKQKRRSPNGGYSLIELVVTVLISSVVVMAVVGFLSTGLRHYRNVNSETLLQTESQVADLFVTELFQEAKNFYVINSSEYPAGVTYAVKIVGENPGVLALYNGELWYSDLSDASDGIMLNDLINTQGKSKAFLAKYVSDFRLSQATQYSDAVTNRKGLVVVKLDFAVDTKTYSNTMVITLRNAKGN